jgi:hypothetical protein
MDAICQLEIYEDKQLFNINAVRMYLQVTTLSEIADCQWTMNLGQSFQGTEIV